LRKITDRHPGGHLTGTSEDSGRDIPDSSKHTPHSGQDLFPKSRLGSPAWKFIGQFETKIHNVDLLNGHYVILYTDLISLPHVEIYFFLNFETAKHRDCLPSYSALSLFLADSTNNQHDRPQAKTPKATAPFRCQPIAGHL